MARATEYGRLRGAARQGGRADRADRVGRQQGVSEVYRAMACTMAGRKLGRYFARVLLEIKSKLVSLLQTRHTEHDTVVLVEPICFSLRLMVGGGKDHLSEAVMNVPSKAFTEAYW